MGRVWIFDLWDGMGGVLLARRRGVMPPCMYVCFIVVGLKKIPGDEVLVYVR